MTKLPMDACKVSPHRPPMLLLDTLVEVGAADKGGLTICETEIRAGNPFVGQHGLLDPLVICELAAQAFAVRQGYSGACRGQAAAKGYLVGVRSAESTAPVYSGDRLRIAVRAVAELEGFIMAEAEVSRGEELVGRAEIKLYTPPDEAADAPAPAPEPEQLGARNDA